jgi:hypothetical protein
MTGATVELKRSIEFLRMSSTNIIAYLEISVVEENEIETGE